MSVVQDAAASTRPVLSDQQVAFFRTFGCLKLPGLFASEIDRIETGFEEAFSSEPEPTILDPANPYHTSRLQGFERRVRDMVPFFVERSENLRWIRHDPRVLGIAHQLLGDTFEYAESDGNLFNCDVYWHIDAFGAPISQRHIKMYFYLDALRQSNGALRVIPGTNHYEEAYAQSLYRDLMADPSLCAEKFGIPLDEIPSWTLEVDPGDLLVGDYRTLHGSFGGSAGRRLFTVNFREATSPS